MMNSIGELPDPAAFCAHHLPTFTLMNGPKASGKSTLTQALVARAPSLYRIGLADPLGRMMSALCILPSNPSTPDWSSQTVKEAEAWFASKPCTYRDLMIALGDAVRSTAGGAALGNLLMADVAEMRTMDPGARFVIDNVRFEDEVRPIFAGCLSSEILTIQLHKDGCTWDGDIGGYIGHTAGANCHLTVLPSVAATLRNLALYLSGRPTNVKPSA